MEDSIIIRTEDRPMKHILCRIGLHNGNPNPEPFWQLFSTKIRFIMFRCKRCGNDILDSARN